MGSRNQHADGDGVRPDGRLFAQKAGQLRVVSAAGQLLASPFVTVNVVTPSEKGLLGVTFDPNYAANRFVYVYYTNAVDGLNQISRSTASQADPNVALAGSEAVILDNISGSSADNHNVGRSTSAPTASSMWPLATTRHLPRPGDLGRCAASCCGSTRTAPAHPTTRSSSRREPGARSTRTASATRSRLRSTRRTAGSASTTSARTRGRRSTRAARARTTAGPTCEGPQGVGVGDCNNPAYTYPVHAYTHALGSAITGGAFYRGSTFPAEFAGDYFYSDYLGDFIRYFDGSDHAWRAANGPVDLKVGPDGALYYASIATGNIQRIQAAGASPACLEDREALDGLSRSPSCRRGAIGAASAGSSVAAVGRRIDQTQLTVL